MHDFTKFCSKVVSNPAFQARGNETYCNFGLRLIAEARFNYDGFNNLNANAICDKVAKEWRKVSAEEAQRMSVTSMVIAAQKGTAHGHVAFVVPEPLVKSGKWNKSIPQVANVGKTNGIMGVNFAFATEPDYYCVV